jgi:hypothetical protein
LAQLPAASCEQFLYNLIVQKDATTNISDGIFLFFGRAHFNGSGNGFRLYTLFYQNFLLYILFYTLRMNYPAASGGVSDANPTLTKAT